ncbi:MAG: MurR/RpiR family transcriptional regulator [Oscillospiraceae bacterium]|nr:MurR/RpiR family transcriptional regulator [Oscillospiraceae bacterium]
MERDILTLINKENRRFSKGQKQIAKYITENYDKAAFMTADKLGRMVGVSESTVVRFASDLGYDGYPDMRRAMQDMVRNRLTAVQRIEVAKEIIGHDNIIESVLGTDIEKLQTTLQEIDRNSFNAAVQAILNAKTIYIVGMRSSTSLASFMGFYLNQMLDNVRLVHDTSVSEVYEQVFRIGEGDVFIGISYPRYSSKTIKAMEFAKSTGATVIGITDGESSPFLKVADIILYAKSDMVSFLDSLVAPMSLINALIVAVGYQRPDNLSDTYHKLEKIWSEYDVYEKLDS